MDEDLRLAAIEASKLFKKGKYDDAVDICTLGISDYPQYSSLYLILAKSYLALGNVSEAHKVFESASKFFVNDPLINTLKDILEATPTIISDPPKKKTQQPIVSSEIEQETTTFVAETEQTEESNSDELILEDELNNQNDIANEVIEEEIFDETSLEEVEVETISYQVETSVEQEDILVEQEEVTSEITLNEIPELKIQEEVIQDIDVEEEQIEFDEVLSGFDQMVSTLDTEEIDEEQEEIFQINDTVQSTQSSSSSVQFVSFETPVLHSLPKNFINKIRTSITPIEVTQFSLEKQQFLSILPSVNAVTDSVIKVHHLDDFQIELENPLQDMNIVANITNEPMLFEDTYISRRRKNADIVVFDNSIEGLDSIDSYVQLSGKKA